MCKVVLGARWKEAGDMDVKPFQWQILDQREQIGLSVAEKPKIFDCRTSGDDRVHVLCAYSSQKEVARRFEERGGF